MDKNRFKDQLVVFVKADKPEDYIMHHIRFIAEAGIIVLLKNSLRKSDISVSSVFSSCIEFIETGEESDAERFSNLVLVYRDADMKSDRYMKMDSSSCGYREEFLSELFSCLGVRGKK